MDRRLPLVIRPNITPTGKPKWRKLKCPLCDIEMRWLVAGTCQCLSCGGTFNMPSETWDKFLQEQHK